MGHWRYCMDKYSHGYGLGDFLGFFGDSIETCDAWAAFTADPQGSVTEPGILVNSVPWFWQQLNSTSENVVRPYLKTQTDKLTGELLWLLVQLCSAYIPPSHISWEQSSSQRNSYCMQKHTKDAFENYGSRSTRQDSICYQEPWLFCWTIVSHSRTAAYALTAVQYPQYPKAYDDPEHARKEKTSPNNDDMRIGTNNAICFINDILGNITQAIKDVGQWDNTILLFCRIMEVWSLLILFVCKICF